MSVLNLSEYFIKSDHYVSIEEYIATFERVQVAYQDVALGFGMSRETIDDLGALIHCIERDEGLEKFNQIVVLQMYDEDLSGQGKLKELMDEIEETLDCYAQNKAKFDVLNPAATRELQLAQLRKDAELMSKRLDEASELMKKSVDALNASLQAFLHETQKNSGAAAKTCV